MVNAFKFQSDSINTLQWICNTIRVKNFKFQSDSINTFKTAGMSANTYTLNSNLILLIPVHAFLVSVSWDNFKFQSDSINTLFLLFS